MRKPKSPCDGCIDRALRCHAHCGKYITYQQQCSAYGALVTGNARREDRVKYSISRLRKMYK